MLSGPRKEGDLCKYKSPKALEGRKPLGWVLKDVWGGNI